MNPGNPWVQAAKISAVTTFDSDKKHVTYLLQQIEQRDLALPDFQRDFVWKPGETRELVRSVMQSFPAGTILLMQGGAKHFKPRSFAQAPDLSGKEPTYLALDGQQRLTSLSLAFSGRGDHLYFLNIGELIEGFGIDEAVEVWHKTWVKVWATIEGQAKELALPLSRLMDYANWKDEVIEVRYDTLTTDERRELKRQLNKIERDWITPLIQYQFPVTTLGSETSLDAVCTIFETLNRTGVKLSVFDLLVARGYAQGVELRALNEEVRVSFGLLDEFEIDPYYILQVVATWVKGNPTRSTVLRLNVKDDIEPSWREAARFLHESLKMLQTECGILSKKYLPYGTMLLTLAAAWREIDAATGPEVGARRGKLRRWFWCAIFAQRYETQANTRTQNDVPDLRKWLAGAGSAPEVTKAGELRSFRQISSNTQALYSAALALSLRNHPLDFHVGQPLTPSRIATDQIDDHHVFPQAFLPADMAKQVKDCVLNRTLIDKVTNIRISAKSPSVYLADMDTALGADTLAAILRSHSLPADIDGPLFKDDYDNFLTWREANLRAQIIEVTGWPSPDAETVFAASAESVGQE